MCDGEAVLEHDGGQLTRHVNVLNVYIMNSNQQVGLVVTIALYVLLPLYCSQPHHPMKDLPRI